MDTSSSSIAQQWIDRWPLVADEPDDDDGDGRPFGVHPISAYVLHQLLESMSDDWNEEAPASTCSAPWRCAQLSAALHLASR